MYKRDVEKKNPITVHDSYQINAAVTEITADSSAEMDFLI